jgi:hypothetical protein
MTDRHCAEQREPAGGAHSLGLFVELAMMPGTTPRDFTAALAFSSPRDSR